MTGAPSYATDAAGKDHPSFRYGMTEEEIPDKKNRGEARQVLMGLLYHRGGMNGREIGEMPGIDYSTVSIARKRLSEKMERDGKLSGLFRELKGGLIQE